jgi:hypothetical protein
MASETKALLSVVAVGGTDGRRPLMMGAVAQMGVGYFYGHLDRWAALYDNRDLNRPIRLRDPRTDRFDDNGEITYEGKVDVVALLGSRGLSLFHGKHVGRTILSKDDVASREDYTVDPSAFAHFAEACRLTFQNERALSRLVADIAQQRRSLDTRSVVVDIDL